MELLEAADLSVARNRVQALARSAGFNTTAVVQIVTAVSEVLRNALMYAGGGRLSARATSRGIRIEVFDEGPGIPMDVQQAIEDGIYQSKTGLGKGISGSRRLMDHFSLMSFPGSTQVLMEKSL